MEAMFGAEPEPVSDGAGVDSALDSTAAAQASKDDPQLAQEAAA